MSWYKNRAKSITCWVLETDVKNFTAGAWWQDFKLGIKNFTKWNKVAIVSDQKGVQLFSDVFRFFIPGTSKGFALGELTEAVEWVSLYEPK